MNHDLAINIDYWAIQERNDGLWQLVGIKEFQDDLSQDYVSRVSEIKARSLFFYAELLLLGKSTIRFVSRARSRIA